MNDSPITLLAHGRLLFRRAFRNFNLGRDMLWGTYTAIGTIVLQALWRLIGEEDWRTRKWLWVASVTAPFVLVIVADIARRMITAPWRVHQDQEEAHREREGELQAEIAAQRDGRERAEAKIRELMAGPVFTGHFYQFMLFPQSGIVPPQMIQEVMDITRVEAGLEKKEYKGDLDVFVELYFVNEGPGECTIIDYSLELFVGTRVLMASGLSCAETQVSMAGFGKKRKPSTMNIGYQLSQRQRLRYQI